MSFFKEIHLVARVLYTLGAVLCFSAVTGFSFTSCLVAIGVPVFTTSFVFQYYVLHFALRETKTARGRNLVLLIWAVVSFVCALIALYMTPSLERNLLPSNVEIFKIKLLVWGTAYASFASAMVALVCARRAWARYGHA